MLFYRNNRFYWEGVSFALPDNLYVQTDPELCEENVLNLWTENEEMHITIGVEEETDGLETELRYIIRKLESTANVGPEKIEMGGLHGIPLTQLTTQNIDFIWLAKGRIRRSFYFCLPQKRKCRTWKT